MKRFLIGLAALTFTVSCGKSDSGTGPAVAAGACSTTPILGTYVDSAPSINDTMVFKSDCSGTSSACQATFTFPNLTASSGNVLVTVTSTSGGSGCLPVGQTSCVYALSGTSLSFNCGGSTLTYAKQ